MSLAPGTRLGLVSSIGGTQPRWSANGKELYFLGPLTTGTARGAGNLAIMVVDIDGSGEAFHSGTPKTLFATRFTPNVLVGQNLSTNQVTNSFDVSPDGQHIYVLNPTADAERSSLTVILNWTAGLKK